MSHSSIQPDPAAHWESVYRAKRDEETSWFQPEPAASLALIRELASRPARILDAGAGASSLAAKLAALGHTVTAVDISESALARARSAAPADTPIRWLAADILSLDAHALGPLDLWHDRAVFHFLTSPPDRARYAALAAKVVVPGGHLAVAAFAPDGPEKCSGLPVQRYDDDALAAEFAGAFTPLRAFRETHVTPWGKPQPFQFLSLRRNP